MLAKRKGWMVRGMSVALIGALQLGGCGDDKNSETTDSGGSTTAPTTGATTGGSTGGTTGENPTTTVSSSTGDASTSGTTGDASTGGSTGNVGGMCNPRTQDCPDGLKCTAYATPMSMVGWDADQCVPAPMNGGGIGDPCQIDDGQSVFSGLDNCAPGGFCFNFDFMTGKGGACIEFCKEDDSCPMTNGGNAGCLEAANMGVLPICLPKCDPLIQDCADMQGCFGDPSIEFFFCAAVDPGPNTGLDNSPCEFTNACQPGFSCQASTVVDGCDPMATGCCTPFCTIGDNKDCSPKEQCVPFYAMNPPPGLEMVGVCAIPQ